MKGIQVTKEIKLTMKKNELDEYEVRVWINGKLRETATYFTDDKEDAENTMREMQRRIEKGLDSYN